MGEVFAMGLEGLKGKLSAIVSDEFVRIRDEVNILGNDGKIVVFPGNEREVAEIMKFAHANRLTVIPEGGATKAGLGGTVKQADILLSLRRMSGIVDYSVADLTMTVLPGTSIIEIEKELENNGQLFPLDVPWPEEASLGGIIAANVSGWKRIRNGSARDMVIGLRVVHPDGMVVRTGGKVVKNVAGYDMNKLYIGSMGTLGVITEVTIKLRPKPVFESIVTIHSDHGMEPLSLLCGDILNSHLEPGALEFLNPAMNHRLTERSGYGLIVAFEDVEKSVNYQVESLMKQMDGHGLSSTILQGNDAGNFWDTVRHVPPKGIDQRLELKAGTWLTDVAPVMMEASVIAEKHGLSFHSHGGAGTGIIHFYLDDFTEDRLAQFVSFVDSLRSLVEQKDGYVIVEHAPLYVRQAIDVWGKDHSAYHLMKGIKKKIDPTGVLSPGRLLGGV